MKKTPKKKNQKGTPNAKAVISLDAWKQECQAKAEERGSVWFVLTSEHRQAMPTLVLGPSINEEELRRNEAGVFSIRQILDAKIGPAAKTPGVTEITSKPKVVKSEEQGETKAPAKKKTGTKG